jgi:ERCC4-type nuclease
MRLIVDTHENKIIAAMKETTDMEFSIESLPCGDLLFEDDDLRLLVERKSAADLCASITDGRYREQRSRLVEWRNDQHKILYLIEGQVDEVTERTLYRLMIAYDIPVWRTIDVQDTVKWIKRVYHQETLKVFFKKRSGEQDRIENIRFSKNMYKKNACNPKNLLISMLNSIHGVSYDMANAIATPYSSVHEFITSYDKDPTVLTNTEIMYKTSSGNNKKIGKAILQRIRETICIV